MIQFKFQNIIDFTDKIILIVIVVICTTFSVTLYAQDGPKTWDESNSELKINSPLITELETDQAFYLRYTQNLSSFDRTKSIDWKIQDINKNVIYSRHLDSNQDRNEAVKIQDPGSYLINLKLQIDTSVVNTTRNIKIIPKDNLYYSGLRLNEINPSTSQIELFNDSNKDIDTSSLIINYNALQKFNLSPLTTVPSKSYVVVNLKDPLNSSEKINLVFEKNTKQSEQHIIDSYSDFSVTDQKDQKKALNKNVQFDTLDKTWKQAYPTLGQINKFDLIQEVKNTELIKGNFQKSETVRTGGFDQSIISILPFLIVFIAYISSLYFDKKEQKSSDPISFAKIKVYLQNYIAWLEVFSLSAILHLQNL